MESSLSRNLDVYLEPLRALTPLSRLFRALGPPDYDLMTSLQPVYEGIANGTISMVADELEVQVKVCLENADDKIFMGSTSLTRDLYASVTLYSCQFSTKECSLYSVLNARLRNADREGLKPFIPYIWLIMHALDLCPPYEGRLVYRGTVNTGINMDEYRTGHNVTWCQFSSCATSIAVQMGFIGTVGDRYLFTIELTTWQARLISGLSLFPQENEEVLLPPNTRLEVMCNMNNGDGLTIIRLKELEPLDPILQFGDRASATTGSPTPTSTPTIMTTPMPFPPFPVGATSSAPPLPPPQPPSGGDVIPLGGLMVDQVALQLESLDLRTTAKEYTTSGVPIALLEEAQGRVRQREQEAAEAALAQRLHHQEQQQEQQQSEARHNADTAQKFITARGAIAKRTHDGDVEALALIDEDVALEVDEEKRTLLHWAAQCGRLALVDPLVAKGAMVDEKNKYGQTPLWGACLLGNKEVALRLIDHGADPSIESNLGGNALEWARGKGFEGQLKVAREKYLDSQEHTLK